MPGRFSKKVSVVRATQGHVDCLRTHLREDDCVECFDAYGVEAGEMLQESFNLSDVCYAIERGGRCIGMYGVAPSGGNMFATEGMPWLLADDEIERVRIAFAKHCPRYVEEIKSFYPVLRNWVDARNHKAIQWLRWLGFTFEKAKPFGVMNRPFYEFWMEG